MLNAWRLTLTGLALILGLFVRFSAFPGCRDGLLLAGLTAPASDRRARPAEERIGRSTAISPRGSSTTSSWRPTASSDSEARTLYLDRELTPIETPRLSRRLGA
jgi:hypothetical protein